MKPAADKQAAAKNGEPSVPAGKTLVAKLVWVKGSFTASMPGSAEKRVLKDAGAYIYMNDTLNTDSKSEAQIVFTDDSTMTFRPDTSFYINKYNYVPKGKAEPGKPSAGQYVMDLITGGFRTITGLVAKDNPNDYQVNTPVATIGVRGTEFSVVYKSGQGLYIKRIKGEPCMKNSAKDAKAGKEICMNAKDKYGYVKNAGSSPVIVAQEPDVFRADVEVVPVNFSNIGSVSGGSGSGFCIQ